MRACVVLVIACCCSATSRAQLVLWDTGFWSGVNGHTSFEGPLDSTRTADDFVLGDAGGPGGDTGWLVSSIRGTLLMTTDPPEALLEVYDDAGGLPGALVASVPAASSVLELSQLSGGFREQRFSFDDLGLRLSSNQTYWVSIAGIDRTGFDVAFFGESALPVQGNAGAWRSGTGPWVDITDVNIDETDFSFVVEGCPRSFTAYGFDAGPWDGLEANISIIGGGTIDARSADDFTVTRTTRLKSITGFHISSSIPPDAILEIYSDTGGSGPGSLLATFVGRVTSTEPTTFPGFDLVEYRFDGLDYEVGAGTYWVSVVGLGDGSFLDTSFFAFAEEADGISGSRAYEKIGDGDWEVVDVLGGGPTDFAFFVEGGALRANDVCAGAHSIVCGQEVAGNTVGAEVDILPFCGTGDAPGGGVWYTIGGTGGEIRISTCHPCTNYNTKLRVWRGSCAGLVCIEGSENSFEVDPDCIIEEVHPTVNRGSTVTFLSTVGETYWILVHGVGYSEGDFVLSALCSEPLCEFDGAPGIDVADLLVFLALWFEGDETTDIDGMAGVAVTDLLAFLACWLPAAG